MQIKKKVNEKQSGGFGSSLLHVPLYLALVKNTESLLIINSEQGRRHEGKSASTFHLGAPERLWGLIVFHTSFSVNMH